jgi:hypothetical protein
MHSCWKSVTRPDQRSDGSDRGCPLGTVIDPPIWHASGTEPRAVEATCGTCSGRPVSWADGNPIVTGVVRFGPVARGPGCGPSGHELGRRVRGHGRQPRYVINHSKGRLSRRCGRRRLPRGFSGVAEGGMDLCRSVQRLTAGAGVEDATGWHQRGRAAWLAPCSAGVPVPPGIRCDRTRPAFGGDRTTNGGANA